MGYGILLSAINMVFMLAGLLYWNTALEMQATHYLTISLMMYMPLSVMSGLTAGYIVSKEVKK